MPRKAKPTHVRIEITVAGTGRFPLDMLRYDQCAPRTSSDAAAITEGDRSERPYFRVVNLNAYRADNGSTGPTVARWESFGWYVLTTDELAAYHSDPSIEAVANLHRVLLKRSDASGAAEAYDAFQDDAAELR